MWMSMRLWDRGRKEGDGKVESLTVVTIFLVLIHRWETYFLPGSMSQELGKVPYKFFATGSLPQIHGLGQHGLQSHRRCQF